RVAADHTLVLSPHRFSEMHQRHCRRTAFRSLLQSCRRSPLRNLSRNDTPTQFGRNRTRTKKTGVLPAFFPGAVDYGAVEEDAEAAGSDAAAEDDGATCVTLTPTPNQCATAKP